MHLISSLCGEPPKEVLNTMENNFFFFFPNHENSKQWGLKIKMNTGKSWFAFPVFQLEVLENLRCVQESFNMWDETAKWSCLLIMNCVSDSLHFTR